MRARQSSLKTLSSILIPGHDVAASIAAERTLLRLESVQPSPAVPLTDDDLAIYQARFSSAGNQFMFFVKASYLEYFEFYSRELGRVVAECQEKLK